MSKKTIRINESALNKIIRSSFNNMITEGSEAEGINVSDISLIAERFERFAQEIKMFIEDYNSFHTVLSQTVQRLDLSLRDYEDNFDEFDENPNRGLYIRFVFNLGIDPSGLYNDEVKYDEYCEKVAQMGEELEDEINPSRYKACRVNVNYDEEIEVECEFGLWE
jgi:hypothetical protein